MRYSLFLLLIAGCGDDTSGADAGRLPDGGWNDAGSRGGADAGTPDGGGSDGGIDAGPIDPSGAAATLRHVLCGPLAEARCNATLGCGCTVFRDLPTEPFEGCVEGFESTCAADYRDLPDRIEAEGARVDEEMAEACIESLNASFRACAVPPRGPDAPRACARVVWSTVAIGSPCTLVGACAFGAGFCDGTTCVEAPGGGESCTERCAGDFACAGGTCVAPVLEGGACTDDEDCASPHACLGGTCGSARESGACTSDAQCRGGFDCVEGECTFADFPPCVREDGACGDRGLCSPSEYGFCQAPHGEGGDCTAHEHCLEGLACSVLDSPGVCVDAPRAGAECTGRCAGDARCLLRAAPRVLECVAPLDLGADCSMYVTAPSCEDGLSCMEGRCRAAPSLGERCYLGHCPDPWLCTRVPELGHSICLERVPVGAECGVRTCVEGAFCDFTPEPPVCRPLAGVGESCTDASCIAGLDCVAAPDELLCLEPPVIGELCPNGVCRDGAFCGPDANRGRCEPAVCDLLAPIREL